MPSPLLRLLKAAAQLLLPTLSAAAVGVFFAHVAAVSSVWLPPLMAAGVCLAVGTERLVTLGSSEAAAFSRWTRFEDQTVTQTARLHGLDVVGLVAVEAPGAFWISAGRRRGIVALGTGVAPEHLPAILAHEFAHGHHNDIAARARYATAVAGLVLIPALAAPLGAEVAGFTAAGVCAFGLTWFFHVCRQQELRADAYAAGFVGAGAVIKMLESFQTISVAEGGVLDAHPALVDRLAAMGALNPADPAPQAV